MRFRARVDDNQNEVVSQLKQIYGLSVRVTSMVGAGFPDLVLGWRGKNYLIELKDGKKSASRKKLTELESKMKDTWFGQFDVCENIEDIFRVLGINYLPGYIQTRGDRKN